MIQRSTTAALLAALALPMAASADPTNQWDTIGPGYDCTGYPVNPGGPTARGARSRSRSPATRNGTSRTSSTKPAPISATGTRAIIRGATSARRSTATTSIVSRSCTTGIRFRYEHFSAIDGNQIPDVPSAEIFRPCANAPGDCPNLPAGSPALRPALSGGARTSHGVIAQKEHHRYRDAGIRRARLHGDRRQRDGRRSAAARKCSAPQNGDDVLRWLDRTRPPRRRRPKADYGAEADLDRVAFTGHSHGRGRDALLPGRPAHPRDDRLGRRRRHLGQQLHDRCWARSRAQPIMYQRTDGGFATPNGTRYDYPTTRKRGLADVPRGTRRAGMDVCHMTVRATVHTDWNGYGDGPGGQSLRRVDHELSQPGLARSAPAREAGLRRTRHRQDLRGPQRVTRAGIPADDRERARSNA